jgi:hypothetical protein
MKSKKSDAIIPLFIFFILVSSFCFLFKNWLDAKQIDHLIVIYANCILFILSVAIFWMHKRSLKNKNPYAFVRSVMAGTFIKLVVIAGGIALYLSLAGENKSLYAIVVALGLYLVYTFIEVKSAARLNKEHGS